MGLSKLTDYAIVILARMARAREAIHTSAALAKATGVPAPTTSKLLKTLKRAGLISSHRGVAGGYQLAREPGAISVAQVIAALEGPVAMTECIARPGACSLESRCTMRPHWGLLTGRIRQVLEQVSLLEMAGPGVATEAAPPARVSEAAGASARRTG